MERMTRRMHLTAGAVYGRGKTCHNGKKIDYVFEGNAVLAAYAMSRPEKTLEAYPCFWCGGWHIGRAMTREETESFEAML